MAVALLNLTLAFPWARGAFDLLHFTHGGRGYVTGEVSTSADGAQLILPPGALFAPPTSSVSIDLWPSRYFRNPLITPASLYQAYSSTISPDGSWELDAPASLPEWDFDIVQYGGTLVPASWPSSLSLVLYASWSLVDVPDDPVGWALLPTDGGGDHQFENAGAELLRDTDPDEEAVHLRGAATALVYPLPSFVAQAVDPYYGADAPQRTVVPLTAPFGQAGLAVSKAQVGWGTDFFVQVPRTVDEGRGTGPFPTVTGYNPGGTFAPGGASGDSPPWIARIAGNEGGTGTFAGFSLFESVGIYDSEPGPQIGPCVYNDDTFPLLGPYTLFFPGALHAPPDLPDVDLGAAIAAMPYAPDWVTIRFIVSPRAFGVSENVNYYGFSGCPTQAAFDTGMVADLIGNEVRYEPRVSGHYHPVALDYETPDGLGGGGPYIVDQEFHLSNTTQNARFGTAAGPAFAGDSFNSSFPSSWNTGTFSTTEGLMVPPTRLYTRRGLVEASNRRWGDLLWRPSDVTTGTCAVHGTVQYLKFAWMWEIAGFWDVGDEYLVPGDQVTLQGVYPAGSGGGAGNVSLV